MLLTFPYLRLLRNMFCGSRHRRQRKVTLPVIESLEVRMLLTNFVVTTLDDVVADDGLVSLREAIEASNRNEAFSDVQAGQENGDTISFDPSLAGGRIMQELGQYRILDDLTITGSETDRIVIDSSDIFARAFVINTNESVSLSNLEITGSQTTTVAGALYIAGDGDVTLTNLDINNNSAQVKGGGIFISSADGSQRVTIIDSTISNNFAGQDGGGIYNYGASVTIERSVINENRVSDSVLYSSVIYYGGGIYNARGSLDLKESLVSGNTSIAGGGIYNFEGFVTIETSVISENRARSGAGIFNLAGTLNIEGDSGNRVLILNNTAYHGGGGVFNGELGSLNISHTLIDGNQANKRGGGIADHAGEERTTTLFDVVISNNIAGQIDPSGDRPITFRRWSAASGGGIYFSGLGQLEIFRSQIDSNLAATAGGGIYSGGFASVTITDTQVVNNEARSVAVVQWPYGAGLHSSSLFASNMMFAENVLPISPPALHLRSVTYAGGGIYSGVGNLTINSSTISGNVGYGNGGGVYSAGGSVDLNQSRVINNTARKFNEEALSGGNGGGVAIAGGNFRAVGSEISNNTSEDGNGGGFWSDIISFLPAGPLGTSDSGGTWLTSEQYETVFIRTQISGNSAAKQGGGMWLGAGSDATITDSTISNNVAGQDGGGIYNDGNSDNETNSGIGNGFGINMLAAGRFVKRPSTVNILGGTTIQGNQAINGGGIYNATGTLNIEGTPGNRVLISNNTALDEGGGIFNGELGSLNISHTLIDSNQARRNGGGIADYAGEGYTTVLSDVVITNNSAESEWGNSPFFMLDIGELLVGISVAHGGGIYFGGLGTLEITRSRIASNSVTSYGGGIYNSTGTINMTQTSIINNEAFGKDLTWLYLGTVTAGSSFGNQSAGGGIYNKNGDMTINRSTILSNIGYSDGGGIFSAGGSITLNKTRVLNNIARRDEDALKWSGQGGGIAVSGGSFYAVDSVIRGNVAEDGNGGGFWGGRDTSWWSVTSAQFDAQFIRTILSGNRASEQGGGMWIGANGDVTLDRTRLINNRALGENGRAGGGGLYNDGGKIEIQRSVIGYNAALSNEGNGGGIYNAPGGEIDIRRFSYIIGNRARQSGGGIYNAGDAKVSQSFILANRAWKTGGAIYNDEEAVLEIVETLFGGNFAPRFSGLFNDGELIRD